MMIDKITPSIDYYQWLKRLDAQLNEPINPNTIIVSKVLIQRIRKGYFKTLGTSEINSSMTSSSLVKSLEIVKLCQEPRTVNTCHLFELGNSILFLGYVQQVSMMCKSKLCNQPFTIKQPSISQLRLNAAKTFSLRAHLKAKGETFIFYRF